jgi:hypothetical protein
MTNRDKGKNLDREFGRVEDIFRVINRKFNFLFHTKTGSKL